jgi:hypothetical protein
VGKFNDDANPILPNFPPMHRESRSNSFACGYDAPWSLEAGRKPALDDEDLKPLWDEIATLE